MGYHCADRRGLLVSVTLATIISPSVNSPKKQNVGCKPWASAGAARGKAISFKGASMGPTGTSSNIVQLFDFWSRSRGILCT